MAMGKLISKKAILVGNCAGFVGNRMLAPSSRLRSFQPVSCLKASAALLRGEVPIPLILIDIALLS